MIGAENVKFQASNVDAGDPGKLAYLHDKDWQGKPFVQVSRVDPRACPGCMFPDAPEGKWPHTRDSRCAEWSMRQRAWRNLGNLGYHDDKPGAFA